MTKMFKILLIISGIVIILIVAWWLIWWFRLQYQVPKDIPLLNSQWTKATRTKCEWESLSGEKGSQSGYLIKTQDTLNLIDSQKTIEDNGWESINYYDATIAGGIDFTKGDRHLSIFSQSSGETDICYTK